MFWAPLELVISRIRWYCLPSVMRMSSITSFSWRDRVVRILAAALSLAQRLAREAGQGTLREAVTRSSGGYVAIYAIGVSAVLVLLGEEGLDVTRLHRESRSVVETMEKLLALRRRPYRGRPRIEASITSAVCATAMS